MGADRDCQRQRLDEIALDFEIAFFEKVVEREPDHIEALMILGNDYTCRGDHRKGLEVDLRLAHLLPGDPIVHYNLACSYSLLERPDEAFAALDEAIALGYRDFEFLQRDRDLDPIRGDERYRRLVERLARV